MTETVGNVILDYSDYPGEDLYSDGDVEERLLALAKKYNEDELAECVADEKTWVSLYHFSHIRENVVSWIPFTKEDRVLEIGSGCGAVTGALAKKAGSVTCVELSKRRSLINANRHREYDNIEIKVGNFETVEKHLEGGYDYITLIGVLEYAGSYIDSEEPFKELLKRVKAHLKPGGKLITAIENRLGAKYFAGCREDHCGAYFQGLEGYPEHRAAITFSRSELLALLEESGFSENEVFYPYPDYKFPSVIFSDGFLPRKGELKNNLNNFDQERMLLFNEAKFFDSLSGTDEFRTFSNSFITISGEGEK